MMTRPDVPSDLAAAGWHYNDRGFLARTDPPTIIVRPDPIAVARQCEAKRAELRAGRKAKQMEMEL